jgi:hypothetical protein
MIIFQQQVTIRVQTQAVGFPQEPEAGTVGGHLEPT